MIFYFFALAKTGEGISGGDRIFIELAKRWSNKQKLNLITSDEGVKLCQAVKLRGKYLSLRSINNSLFLPFYILNYIYKVLCGIYLGLTLKLGSNLSEICLYSASEFWMDSLPCFLLKLRFSKVRWAAAWYQTAPNPFVGYSERGTARYRLRALIYWLMQKPVKPVIARFADYVLVNNEEEKKQFPKHNKMGRAIVVLGAVDIEKINSYKLKAISYKPIYDAVFQGRFHPQKGVLELVDIWRKVVNKRPSARLAMIGDGPLMENLKLKIKNLKLENNIKLFGWVFDGSQKYKIFSQSKIVLHPALYDSGGMAAAEAMAFGLPGVAFDLKAYISYYPQGMVKVKFANLQSFSDTIIKLLSDSELRLKLGQEAEKMVIENWSWDDRADMILSEILK